jgi:hypothetical protein
MFSFGFTSYQSTCNNHLTETKKEHVDHDCCHVEDISCDIKTGCEDNCCLQPITMFELNEFVGSTNKEVPKLIVFESIKQLIKLVQTKVFNNDLLFESIFFEENYCLSGSQSLSLNQSWVI